MTSSEPWPVEPAEPIDPCTDVPTPEAEAVVDDEPRRGRFRLIPNGLGIGEDDDEGERGEGSAGYGYGAGEDVVDVDGKAGIRPRRVSPPSCSRSLPLPLSPIFPFPFPEPPPPSPSKLAKNTSFIFFNRASTSDADVSIGEECVGGEAGFPPAEPALVRVFDNGRLGAAEDENEERKGREVVGDVGLYSVGEATEGPLSSSSAASGIAFRRGEEGGERPVPAPV